jgi:predicted amidophosphoribosyltransferase
LTGVRSRIAELKNERLCACGQIVALDANFCPHCGRKLEELPLRKEPVLSKEPAPTVTCTIPYMSTKMRKHQYYGEEELTEAERELAKRPEQPVQYADVLPVIEVEPEPEEYERVLPDTERGRREADELERERERQLELDRRIRDWKASEPAEETAVSESGTRDIVKCQICRADLPKGSMWCPRCGSEQI